MAPIIYSIIKVIAIPFLILLFVIIYTSVPNRKSIRIIFRTLGRDIKAIYWFLKVVLYLKICQIRNHSVLDKFRNVVKKHKNKVCFYFEDEEWTYQKVDEFSNKVANCFHSQGYRKGDEVALFLENCPEYICIWLGLAKIGVVSAFINTNLRQELLAHSINVINTKAIIFGSNFADAVKDAMPLFNGNDTIEYFCYSRNVTSDVASSRVKSLNHMLMDASDSSIDSKRFPVNFDDKLLYIYTSGTTGLPKAAVFKHSRFLYGGAGSYFPCKLSSSEIIYNTLPLYHSAGGIFFVSLIFNFGGSMILRRKFSSANYWKDAVKYKATVGQYIGEICRYLLNTPKCPEETQHCIKLMFGNGLRGSLWKEFQDRFKIKHIVEIYSATEGNASLINTIGKPGAVGFIINIFRSMYKAYLIKVNPENGEPLRGANGLCIICGPGEPGEMAAQITRRTPISSFDGYVNQAETQKKLITDCFQKGDTVFLTGDILVADEEGCYYFVDRIGDTFRWHGENVSTHEVETLISKVLGYVSCVVYGVEVPNTEGRAGMAAIQKDNNDIDMGELYLNLTKRLPPYAVPLFIRICSDIESTGTYKLKKTTLQREGYDPEKVTKDLYFIDHSKKTYVLFTRDMHSDILNGKMRL